MKMVHLPQNISLKPLFKEVLVAELKFGFLLLICVCSGQSTETSKPQLVTAMVGEDVVLPCHLEVPLKADELVVEWGRLDLSPRFVYQWFEGSDYNDDQNIAYKGRTSLFTDRLKDGDASLRLKSVKHSDNGRFRCYNAKKIEEYFVDLLVGSISLPGIGLAALDENKNGVMLDCSSAGWYPEPEIFWLDGEGNIMSAGPTEKLKSPDGLYSISSRVTVEKKHNNITCRVQQRDINQTREKHIYVQDGLFVPPSNCSVSVSFSVILGLILLFGVPAGIIWKWRPTKKSIKKQKDEMNEEKHQLLKEENYLLSKKKSDLEEDLRKRNQDQRSVDQQIEALMKMSEELQQQKERLTDQRQEVVKIVEENERKLKAVDCEIGNQQDRKTERKAQGYLKLKEIITESNDRLTEGEEQKDVEIIPEKLIDIANQEVKKLKERKQEIENDVVQIEKKLEEMQSPSSD